MNGWLSTTTPTTTVATDATVTITTTVAEENAPTTTLEPSVTTRVEKLRIREILLFVKI